MHEPCVIMASELSSPSPQTGKARPDELHGFAPNAIGFSDMTSRIHYCTERRIRKRIRGNRARGLSQGPPFSQRCESQRKASRITLFNRKPSLCRGRELRDELRHVLLRDPIDVDVPPIFCQRPNDVLGVMDLRAPKSGPVRQKTNLTTTIL